MKPFESYILEADHSIREAVSMEEVEVQLQDMDSRQVGLWESAGVRVSTVFLCINHAFGEGPPVLFETMLFIDDITLGAPGWLDEAMTRYRTWDEAADGHTLAVATVEIALAEKR